MKKLSESFDSFGIPLVEAISKILYHRTELHHLDSILKDNEFRLSSTAGTQSDRKIQPKGKLYFMSLTRSASTGYQSGSVILEIDGEKLGRAVTGGPVDYWGPEFRKAKPTIHELEDRVWSEKPTIPNAMSYIREIHILVSTNETLRGPEFLAHQAKRLRGVLIAAKKNNIPVHLYTNADAFRLLDTRREVSLQDIPLTGNPPEQTWRPRDPDRPSELLDGLVELYHKSRPEDLSHEAKDLIWKLAYVGFASQVEAELHNEKKSKAVRGITDIMAKAGFKSVAELVSHLKGKWHKA